MSNVVVFERGPWSIDLRERNCHAGKKVWVCYHGTEVASYDERGSRNRCNNKVHPTDEIDDIAKRVWKQVAAGVEPEDLVIVCNDKALHAVPVDDSLCSASGISSK